MTTVRARARIGCVCAFNRNACVKEDACVHVCTCQSAHKRAKELDSQQVKHTLIPVFDVSCTSSSALASLLARYSERFLRQNKTRHSSASYSDEMRSYPQRVSCLRHTNSNAKKSSVRISTCSGYSPDQLSMLIS